MSRLSLLLLALLPGLLPAQQTLIPRYRAAELGDPDAQVEVGQYYVSQAHATALARNLTEARDWYDRAAKQGHPIGMLRLAELHLRAEPEVRDPVEAFRWMDRLYETNHPESGCNAALARFYVEGVAARDGRVAVDVDPRKAYYHILLQQASGSLPHDLGLLRADLRKRLPPADVKDAEDRAFRWVENHNKPALRPDTELAAGDGSAKAGKKTDKDGKATTTDEPIDTSDKALALALKHQQESARQVAPLGKPQRYVLPGPARDKK
ncbi:MAG: enhanced entry protein EnhC [Verrucomicrobiota bacterium]|jgi:hypothetical protein